MEKDLHEEILKDVLSEESKKSESLEKIKKVVFSLFVLMIIFMIIVTFLGGGRLIDFLEGRIVSSTIKENSVLVLTDGSKVHLNNVYDELKKLFYENQKNEFKVCLVGRKENNDYYVGSLYIPRIFKQNVFSVTSEQCNNETIIPLHSHPLDRCVFSAQDIISYHQFKEINPDALLGLMCNLDRFTFYSK